MSKPRFHYQSSTGRFFRVMEWRTGANTFRRFLIGAYASLDEAMTRKAWL